MNRRLALIAVSSMMLAIVSVWAQQGPPPLETALDTNADGVIDAGETARASASLKTLDKNGDGKLTSDEYRPPHAVPLLGGLRRALRVVRRLHLFQLEHAVEHGDRHADDQSYDERLFGAV